MKNTEIVIVGGGIVGMATAMALSDRDVLVLEEESSIGSHQTGHNSGVIHSGLYYKPGSSKARNCISGRELMYNFCQENGIPHERCGKLVVAVSESEVSRLKDLEERGRDNGIWVERVDAVQMREVEPCVKGLAGLWVRDTGIVNYKDVIKVYCQKVGSHRVLTGTKFLGCRSVDGGILVETSRGVIGAKYLINCGGLYSDRIARRCGLDPVVKIIPFRGEYYELKSGGLVRNLIYPVPDPRLPFLGVHFTRMIGGGVECGPNAVLALSRRGYSWGDFSFGDNMELLSFGGFWKMAYRFWRVGISEVLRSFSKRRFYESLSNLVEGLKYSDIYRSGSGVRAQAVGPDGKLVDDFYVVRNERTIHVLNAPSPAATASISIGRTIAAMV